MRNELNIPEEFEDDMRQEEEVRLLKVGVSMEFHLRMLLYVTFPAGQYRRCTLHCTHVPRSCKSWSGREALREDHSILRGRGV